MLFQNWSQLVLSISLLSFQFTRMASVLDCSDYEPGNDVVINATCHHNGTIEFLAQRLAHAHKIRVEHNCTGPNPQEGVDIQFANNGKEFERGSFQIEDWNYTNSICYFDGCYDQDLPLAYFTYSLSSVACTVLPLPSSTVLSSTPTPTPLSSTLAPSPSPSPVSPTVMASEDDKNNAVIIPSVTSLLFLMLLAVVFLTFYIVTMMARKPKNTMKWLHYDEDFHAESAYNDITIADVIIQPVGSVETLTDALGDYRCSTNKDNKDEDNKMCIGMENNSVTTDDTHSECDTYTLSEPGSNCKEINFLTSSPVHQTSGQSSQYVGLQRSRQIGSTEVFESENVSMCFEEEFEYGITDQSREEDEVSKFGSSNLNAKNFQEESETELKQTEQEKQESSTVDPIFVHEDRTCHSECSCSSGDQKSTGGYVDSGFSATTYRYFQPPPPS